MSINFKKTVKSNDIEQLISKITEELKKVGFGVLTRIDFSKKIKEKLNIDLPTEVVLGACDPKLAYQIYSQDKDITSLMPCNVVVREISKNQFSVEAAKPTAIVSMLNNSELTALAVDGDNRLAMMLESL